MSSGGLRWNETHDFFGREIPVRSDQTYRCAKCGALVANERQHQEWHDVQAAKDEVARLSIERQNQRPG